MDLARGTMGERFIDDNGSPAGILPLSRVLTPTRPQGNDTGRWETSHVHGRGHVPATLATTFKVGHISVAWRARGMEKAEPHMGHAQMRLGVCLFPTLDFVSPQIACFLGGSAAERRRVEDATLVGAWEKGNDGSRRK